MPAQFFALVECALTQQLDDVPAELGAERLADLIRFERRENGLELRVECARRTPAEVAAAACRARILRSHARERAEVLACQNAIAECGKPLTSGGIVLHLIGAQQDVSGVDLLDQHRPGAGAARFVKAHNVEACWRAHRVRDLARLHASDQVSNELRQLVESPPAELAALESRLRLRVGQCELPEVLTRARAVMNLRGELLDAGHLLRGCGFRQRQQDVRDVEFGILVGLLRLALQGLIELARRHVDAREDIALAQHRDRDFAAHVVAIRRVVHALGCERDRHLFEWQAIALCDVAQRLVQHLVRYPHTQALGALQLDFLQHEALEHLLPDHVGRRQLGLLVAQPVHDQPDLGVELALQHDALVDDRDDAIERHAARGQFARLRMGSPRQRQGGKQADQNSAHGVPGSG